MKIKVKRKKIAKARGNLETEPYAFTPVKERYYGLPERDKPELTPKEVGEFLAAQREYMIRQARIDFWMFCKLLHPDFFKEDREYLKEIAHTLQAFYEGKIPKQILLINMPPRHGKTFIVMLFVCWMFGREFVTRDRYLKIITGSYNESMSKLFSQNTRNEIMFLNDNVRQFGFHEIFPDISIQKGDSAKGFWSLQGSPEKNYLASSQGGTATGIGANYMIMDDLIKDSIEAYNERVLQETWEWYNNTMVSRLEDPRKQIIVMTRWSSEDLAGRLLEKRGDQVYQITYKAVQEDGSMLCDEILSYDEYLDVTKEMGKEIAEANYQQEPIDGQDRLYQKFKTYKRGHLPEFIRIAAYFDTADEGDDYLAGYIYGETDDNEAYILDVIYTRDGMEKTEPEAARLLYIHEVNLAWVESNSGGRGWARAVETHLKNDWDSNHTVIRKFHQSKNKKARILSQATWCMEHIYFPENWIDKWPDMALALLKFKRIGENIHDDAADGLTGVSERCGRGMGMKVFK